MKGHYRANVDPLGHVAMRRGMGCPSCSSMIEILRLLRRADVVAIWARRNVAESEVRSEESGPGRCGREGERPGLWTLEETADWLAVSERMVRRLVAERRIPYVKVGRYVRFRPEDVEAWRDGNVHPAVVILRPRLVG